MRHVLPNLGDARELSENWRLAGTEPGCCEDARSLGELSWVSATVPGTVAAALDRIGDTGARDLDAMDWWFRTAFDADVPGGPERLVLALDGLATIAEVYLNGERVICSDSMFAAHRVEVTERLRGTNELAICCRALAPLLRVRRRPRARWRTKLVADANLRFFRTMLLGRAPGFAPDSPVVGPWRPVRLERWRHVALEGVELRATVQDGHGVLSATVRARSLSDATALDDVAVELSGPTGVHRATLRASGADEDGAVIARGRLTIPDVARWWPHTHGDPALYRARMIVRCAQDEHEFDVGRVGFRTLEPGSDLVRDGIQLSINGVSVFARGAVWTPLDLAEPHASEADLRRVLETVAAAGMNMLRVPGIACYESDRFYDLADELGILIWQDFMFANLDYPEHDPEFMARVEREARGILGALGSRPSLAVLCGGSEVAQQVAMLGLDPELANGPLYAELLPSLVRAASVDAPYVPSTPWGGELPFRPDRGVANYYGVGAYLRGLTDARLSDVKFAAECLAFANVPDDEALEAIGAPGGPIPHDPAWKAGVPRDAGAAWDFEDVRDHYLRLLFELDPVGVRSSDPVRYLELSRAVSGEVMSEVFGEWRREESRCGGGLVLWLTDLRPGAGWGLLDDRGEPKLALHHLRRVLAPVAVWSTDEGLGGMAVHVANDRPEPLAATLRVALYRNFATRVEEIERELELAPHSGWTDTVEGLLGRFVDVTWAYRFGPPGQDLIVLSLERPTQGGTELLSQSFRMPAGRPSCREVAAGLGLEPRLCRAPDGDALLTVSAARFVYCMRVSVPGHVAEDDGFSIEPGHQRQVRLRRVCEDAAPLAGSLTALNLDGRIAIRADESP